MSSSHRSPIINRKIAGLSLALTCALSSLSARAAAPLAQEISVASRVGGAKPSLSNPLKIAGPNAQRTTGFQWIGPNLRLSRTEPNLFGLEVTEVHSDAIFDPSSSSWFASAHGSLVRVLPNGSLLKVADDVEGTDLDVRESNHIVVSCEPNDAIVYRRWSNQAERFVLAQGQGFFGPRLSKDGSQVVFSESRGIDGHIWVVAPPRVAVDLGQGYDPVLHPDGRRVFFIRHKNDGYTILSSDIWVVDIDTRTEKLLATTPIPEVQPSISADGRYIAFRDGRTHDAYLALLDEVR